MPAARRAGMIPASPREAASTNNRLPVLVKKLVVGIVIRFRSGSMNVLPVETLLESTGSWARDRKLAA
jgi:hypothetical protein